MLAADAPAQIAYLHFRTQVEELFDDYAEDFEQSLHDLGYDVPAQIVCQLVAARGADTLSHCLAVDVGCGTGLAGVQLRARCNGLLIGCDLSVGMLREAEKKRGVYDRLEERDAVAFLRRLAPLSADLIVATDVVVYMHALADLLCSAARALRLGGLFAFSTELCSLQEAGGLPPAGRGWVERPSERIAHCEEYVRALVQQSDELQLTSLTNVVVRSDEGSGIQGQLVVLTRAVAQAEATAGDTAIETSKACDI